MALAWLQQSAIDLAGVVPAWFGRLEARTLAIAALGGVAVVLTIALFAIHRRWRAAAARSKSARSDTEILKEELRRRLSETGALLADGIAGAPTMGASEAFEGDMQAAARTLLLDAGGRRAKAKELLRQRVDGNVKLNGSEAGYWRQLGALALLDSTADAVAAYARAAELAPEDPEAQMLAGVLHLRTGNLAAAEAAFRRQIALGDGAAGGFARYRGHTMLGDVQAMRGEHDAALASYAQAQREVRALLGHKAEQVGLQRDLSVTCDRIGDMHAGKGDVDAALACYRESLMIAEALAEAEAGNPAWQHDLSVSHDRIGEMLEKQGDREAALESFRKGLAIAGSLALRDPDNLQWQWDLSLSHDRIGDVLIAEGRQPDALESYARGLAIAEQLARRDPGNAAWQRDLAVSYHKLGSIVALDDPAEARELLVKGRAIIDRLARIAAHQAQWRSDLSRFDEMLRSLEG